MRLLFVAFAVIFCLLPMNALGGTSNSYTGTWEYRQRNPGTETGYDDEGERLQFSYRNGILEGIYFGLEREGEHGLFYSVVKMKDLRVTDDGVISFVVPERALFSERPAILTEAEKKKEGAGFTRHEMKMRGQIEKGRLVLKCTSTDGECPDNVMSFKFVVPQALADDDYVSFAKSLPAKKYDISLPSIPTEQWLTSSLPPGIVAVWGSKVTDCGEQTGDPAIDRERDMPLCVEIELKQKDKLVGYLLLFVGTEKKGKLKEAAGLYYGYIKQEDKTIDLKKLQEITKLR